MTATNTVSVHIVDKSPKPINEVILHVGAHVDEYEAYRRVRAYGERFFPGCAKAQVRFTLGMPARTDAEFDGERKLPVGCGQARFDEHRSDVKPYVERLPNECATTLVSTYLEITHDKILKRLADETLRHDTEPGTKSTELPELTKMFQRRLKNGDEFILRWTVKALNAIQHQLYYAYAPVDGEKMVLQIFDELAETKHLSQQTEREKKAAEKTREFLQESVARTDKVMQQTLEEKRIFELAFIVECLYRTKLIEQKDVLDWVRFPLEHLYADQLEFLMCVERCKELKEKGKCWESITAFIQGRRRTLKLFYCKTNSSAMQRAARYCGAAVVILQNSLGQVNVFVNSEIGLTLADYTRMARWLEIPDKTAATWDELAKDGMHPLIPQWYYFKKAEQLFNGSLTHPNTPATKLHCDVLREIAQYAFNYKRDGVPAWRRKHKAWGKRTERKPHVGRTVKSVPKETPKSSAPSNQPAPEVKPAADAQATAPTSTAEPVVQTSAAGESSIEEALKHAKSRKSRSKKAA